MLWDYTFIYTLLTRRSHPSNIILSATKMVEHAVSKLTEFVQSSSSIYIRSRQLPDGARLKVERVKRGVDVA